MYARASLAHLWSVAAAVGSGGQPTRCPVGSLAAAVDAPPAAAPPVVVAAAAAAAACDSKSGVLCVIGRGHSGSESTDGAAGRMGGMQQRLVSTYLI